MGSTGPNRVFLTFDVEGPPGREDFMDSYSLKSLRKVLKLLERYSLRGLFFITGNVIEKICRNREVFQLLERHEIGFHSSSHSVKPRIFEYTDLPDYNDAVKESIKRETSRIDPFTGKIAGNGGILLLRESFAGKNIEAFKTPFDYFSPPHSEALQELGFKFVFSCDLYHEPVFYRGFTFYPRTRYIDGISGKFLKLDLSNQVPLFFPFFVEASKTEKIVLGLHPSHFLFNASQLGFNYRNPMYPFRLRQKASVDVVVDFSSLELIFLKLSLSQRAGLLDLSMNLDPSKIFLNSTRVDIERNYRHCLSISSGLFGYRPKFLLLQFDHFLENKP